MPRPVLHDDAWKPADDDFDLTDLIATPFCPFASERRTVIRSMDAANFPSFIPSFRLICSRSSSSICPPRTRTCAGGGTAWVRLRVSFTGRGNDVGTGQSGPPLAPVDGLLDSTPLLVLASKTLLPKLPIAGWNRLGQRSKTGRMRPRTSCCTGEAAMRATSPEFAVAH